MKRILLNLWMIESHLRAHIQISQSMGKIPIFGRYLSLILDRLLLVVYGIDLDSKSIQVKVLSISHPSGIVLGGNGITSRGRVGVMPGVKFVGRSPTDVNYLARHRLGSVFSLGDNVIIGAGSTIVGPVTICDNVVIGAMSLVNVDISEPGTYVGIPVRKVSDKVSGDWFQHI